MCPRKQSSLSEDEFTLEQFKHTLSLFPRVNTVILLGRGETFLMRDLFPILDFGSRKGVHFVIVTNGTMLTSEAIKKLPSTGKIVVSIDNPNPDKYRGIRGGGDLRAIISSLKELRKNRPDQWICIQCVMMKSNIDNPVDLIKLAEDVAADAVKLIYPIIFDRATESIYIGSSNEMKFRLAEARGYAKKAGIRFIAVPSMNKPRVCVEPWLGLRVALNGDIYPCCYINNTAGSLWNEWHDGISIKVPQSNYVMGNVYDKTVREIWNGERFRSLRRAVVVTKPGALLSVDRLNALRNTVNVSQRFSYCSVCLYRQNRAC
jgi:MoaA/NifB/PqqE/SkfB family radical SAM enzyme